METPYDYLEGSAAAATPHGNVALAFARALVAGEYEAARAMLSSLLQATTSAARLRTDFESMIDYFTSPASAEEFIMTSDMDDWLDKQPTDIGWAYVAISSETFNEAVSVVVTDEQGKKVIREIMWGRP